MQAPDLLLLYVKDVDKSAGFYRDLLNREPQAAFPTYVAFSLDGGFTLALWSAERAAEEWAKQRATANLPPAESGNRFELAFQVEDEEVKIALIPNLALLQFHRLIVWGWWVCCKWLCGTWSAPRNRRVWWRKRQKVEISPICPPA